MKLDPKQIASIIDSRAAAIETLDNDIMMETVGVAMALDKLRASLDKLAVHLDDMEFEKASNVGYDELAHNFVAHLGKLVKPMGCSGKIAQKRGGSHDTFSIVRPA